LAALSVAQSLNLNQTAIVAGFQHFKPAFGRLETIKLKDKVLKLLLVKNPTGFNQVLHTFKHLIGEHSFACLLALNDLIADGRDVSWIWDVDVENLTAMPNLKKVIVSGTRTEDMALRIKYANLKLIAGPSTSLRTSKLQLEKDLAKAVNKLLSSNLKHLFILPTYTAMLEIRKILNKKGLAHSTWED
jgi:UDP-N-acetylmuramyl tripeptide synthase